MDRSYNQKIGQFGEDLAVDFLERRGYKIVERNVKTSYKELDIIAEFKEKTVFIEVKTRTNNALGSAEDALGSKKLANVKRAVMMYMRMNKIWGENARVDFIAVDVDRKTKKAKIKHYKDIIS